MTTERIDIEVNDKGADVAATNLRRIADEADRGYTYVQRLNSALGAMNPSATLKQAAASANAATALAREEGAASRLAASQRQASAAARTLATDTAAAGAAAGKATVGFNTLDTAVKKSTAGMGKAGMQNANIIAQLNDIGVSLAGGQNPLLVLIQQGSQLQYIASTMEGGVKALIGSILRMLAPFAAAAAVIGVLVAKLAMFKSEINAAADTDNFVKGLQLTKKELKELGDTSVTWGDTFKGVMATISDALNLDDVWQSFKDAGGSAVNFVYDVLVNFAAGAVGLFTSLFRGLAALWNKFPALVGQAVTGAANLVIAGVEWIINKVITGINMLSAGVNSILPKGFTDAFGQIGKIGEVSFGRMQQQGGNAAGEIASAFIEGGKDGFNGLKRGLDQFSDYAKKKSIEARNKRLTDKANELKEDRNAKAVKDAAKGKEDKTTENRAAALAKVNLQLDNELSRMKMLKEERTIQLRLDQIEESLAQKKIKLTDDETAALKAKITAIEKYKYVQAEADRIVETSIGPQRTLTASIDAANQLLADGVIVYEEYMAAMRLAERTYSQATDPLFTLTEAIEAGERATTMYGDAIEKNNYLESIRQAYAARGKGIYDETTGAIRAEVAALVARNDALRQQQFIQSQLGAVLNPILEQNKEIEGASMVYAELERLRAADLIREDAYQQAKAALFVKYNEQKLSAVSGFFGDLASVTAKGHGVVGAISKAAAVAQATIDGYLAVQKALATIPPPFNIAAAAGIALKTGANVAGILSTNAGSFANGGQFMVAGKSGVDANNINMNVTKGERVTIETAKQQRANDNSPSGAPTIVKNKIVNVMDPKEALSAFDTEEGEELILNIMSRRRQDAGQILGVAG